MPSRTSTNTVECWLLQVTIILSRASKAGSPTNFSGSDKTRGQGYFGPSTGGPDLQGKLDNHLDKKNLKGTNRTFDLPFLLRQGEPGTSQYITRPAVSGAGGCHHSALSQRDKSLKRRHRNHYCVQEWKNILENK